MCVCVYIYQACPWKFMGWWESLGFCGKLLPVTPLNTKIQDETKIKVNRKPCQILVYRRATLYSLSTSHSRAYQWHPGKIGRSLYRVRILTRVSSSKLLENLEKVTFHTVSSFPNSYSYRFGLGMPSVGSSSSRNSSFLRVYLLSVFWGAWFSPCLGHTGCGAHKYAGSSASGLEPPSYGWTECGLYSICR